MLHYLRRHSTRILLAHVIFTAGARILLAEFAPWGRGLPLLALTLACGVVGRIVLYEAAKRPHLATLLGFD
jgi:hypothetical protein